MSIANKSSRARSTPFLINIWGYNRNSESRQNITRARNQGDLWNITLDSIDDRNAETVRFLLPNFNYKLTEAYFTLDMNTENAETLQLAFAEFGANGVAYEPIKTGYSKNYLRRSHRAITKRNEPFDISNGVSFSNKQIGDALRNLTQAQRHRNGFAVLFVFDQPPGIVDITQMRIIGSGEVTP